MSRRCGQHHDRRRQAAKPHSSVRERINMMVAELDDGVCQLCFGDVDLTLPPEDMMSAARDHVVSFADGGPYTVDNLRLAHRLCNEVAARMAR